jgi:hypothetical protein
MWSEVAWCVPEPAATFFLFVGNERSRVFYLSPNLQVFFGFLQDEYGGKFEQKIALKITAHAFFSKAAEVKRHVHLLFLQY